MPAYLGSEGVMLNAALEIQNDGAVLEKLIKRTISTYENPYLSEVGDYAFAYCRSLTSVNLPQATSIGKAAFYGCTSLASIDLPLITTIVSYAFRNCYNLLSLYLLGYSIPILTSINAFYLTPISTYTTSTGGIYGSIYVPASLYSSYLTATNWSIYSSRIVSIGD